ncbi:MAG TPA: CinA family protein, partial [Devosia sp.]|nr:CinA family protein [Devosia sp.]
NAAKQAMIGVPATLIEGEGAVSEPVARVMAEGALKKSAADIAIAVTGIAGPGGGTPQKPVGLVHFGCAMRGRTYHMEKKFGDIGRECVRLATVNYALEMVLEVLESQP